MARIYHHVASSHSETEVVNGDMVLPASGGAVSVASESVQGPGQTMMEEANDAGTVQNEGGEGVGVTWQEHCALENLFLRAMTPPVGAHTCTPWCPASSGDFPTAGGR